MQYVVKATNLTSGEAFEANLDLPDGPLTWEVRRGLTCQHQLPDGEYLLEIPGSNERQRFAIRSGRDGYDLVRLLGESN